MRAISQMLPDLSAHHNIPSKLLAAQHLHIHTPQDVCGWWMRTKYNMCRSGLSDSCYVCVMYV